MWMKRSSLSIALLSLCLAACPGNNSTNNNVNYTCPATFTACGGAVVGTWKYVTNCPADTGTTIGCGVDGGTITVGQAGNISETITLGADGTFQTSVMESGSSTVVYSPACTSFVTDCTQLNNGNDAGTCSGTPATGCSCVTYIAPMTLAESGTYSVSGTSISVTLSSDGGIKSGGVSPYCVQGNFLLVNGNAMGMGTGPASFSVFARQ